MSPSRRSFVRPPAFESLEGRRLLSRTLPVWSLLSDGAFTLRSMLREAVDGDTIDLRPLQGTLSLEGVITIDKSVTLVGPGVDDLTITQTGDRAFVIKEGLDVKMSGFRIDDAGLTDRPGGGIYIDSDINSPNTTLTLNDVWVTDCVAAESGGGLYAGYADVKLNRCRFARNSASGPIDALGGGVYVNVGSLVATDCTFDGNTALASVGHDMAFPTATALGGGVCLMNARSSSFTNCTFANNIARADISPIDAAAGATAEAYGGAIAVFADGDFSIVNCTIARNTARGDGATTFGGGINVFAFGAVDVARNDTLKIANSVIAGNTADVGSDAFGLDVSATGTAYLKNNVVGVVDDSGFAAVGRGIRSGSAGQPLDARLSDLADNGGPVPTMYPMPGSPVLGVANPSDVPRRDARGYPRSASYDIGAIERQSNYAPGPTVYPSASATAFVPYVSNIAATDVDGDPVSVTLVAGPAWLTLVDHGDGTATLAGTPSADDGGPARVTLRASDGVLSWDESFTLDVAVAAMQLTSDGLLRVVGTDDVDVIHVWQPKGTGAAIRVAIGRHFRNYSAAAVTNIQIFGRGGNDILTGNCVDLGVYVNAGDGNDTVIGGALADSLTAAGGDDVVQAMGGDDWIDGNSGRDNLQGGDGDDRIYGGNGGDTLDGGLGRDVMYGEVGSNLYLSRDRNRDRIFALDPLTNFVDGDEGRDILVSASALPPALTTRRPR